MAWLKMLRGSFYILNELLLDELKSRCGFDSRAETAPELPGPVSPSRLASATDV